MKKTDYRVMSNYRCIAKLKNTGKDCRKPIKQNVVNANPGKNIFRCFKHYMRDVRKNPKYENVN